MSLHLFGSRCGRIRTGDMLWNIRIWPFGPGISKQMEWVVPSPGLPDPLIYLLCIFFTGAPWRALCTTVNSEMDLVAQISISVATIPETASIFECVRQSMSLRCRACLHANSCNFEYLLWCFYVILFIYYCFLDKKAFFTAFCVLALQFLCLLN